MISTWLTLAASQDIPWPQQLAIAVPFVLALAWVGRWLFGALQDERQANRDLTNKIMDKVVPALDSSAEATKGMLELARDLARRLNEERDERIRLQERMRR